MKTFVNVRNWVTINATLPGNAERGTMKLINETKTMDMQGK